MKITLNREQIGKLNEVVDNFHEINKFTIETDDSMEAGVSVRFDLFDVDNIKKEKPKMKDSKIVRRVQEALDVLGNYNLAVAYAQEIRDDDLRSDTLDEIDEFREFQDMEIPPPNYSKKNLDTYSLGKNTPYICEQANITTWPFPSNTSTVSDDQLCKSNTVLVMVECVSQFRQRYVIEVDADHPEYALDDVAMERYKEFSQVHLGEVIVSHRVVSVDEVIEMCDVDNAYVKSWSDEKKLQVFVTESAYESAYD